MLIAGDIGGTKTRFAVYSLDSDVRSPIREATYLSREYKSFQAVLEAFFADLEERPRRACFGVAGPVVDDQVRTTNLPWVVNANELADRLGFEQVTLLNDLESIANAVPILAEQDLVLLKEGDPEPGGAIAIVAPGTGLGEAFLTWSGERYQAHPSEGGHVDFAPTSDEEIALLRFLRMRFRHVSYERICSGSGLPNIYDFYRETGAAKEPDWLRRALSEAEDPTPVIVQAALDPAIDCRICDLTLETFISVLAAEAGNLTLKVLATGGLYLGGGIPPKILPLLKSDVFLTAFERKGRFSPFLKQVKISVILNDKAALLGAANFGLERS